MRLIDADALTKRLAYLWNVDDDSDFANKEVWHAVEEAPTVDVPERKVGEWIWEDSEERWGWACSNCGYGIRGDRSKTNYCPNCGAEMKGEEDG